MEKLNWSCLPPWKGSKMLWSPAVTIWLHLQIEPQREDDPAKWIYARFENYHWLDDTFGWIRVRQFQRRCPADGQNRSIDAGTERPKLRSQWITDGPKIDCSNQDSHPMCFRSLTLAAAGTNVTWDSDWLVLRWAILSFWLNTIWKINRFSLVVSFWIITVFVIAMNFWRN